MINLLPPAIKSDYGYARHNVVLIRWVVICALALIGLAAIGTGGFVYMQQLSTDYQKQIDTKQQSLQEQKLNETKKQAKAISDNLKLAVEVLGKEVLFSDLLQQLAKVTPANTSLSNLNINQTTGALDITASTTSNDTATQLQVNLEDPANKIFSKADIVNIVCNSSTDNKQRYPCTVTIHALFAPNNPFLFINAEKQP